MVRLPNTPMSEFHLPARSLPVLRTADIAVIGGSFAGVAAALRFRQAGLRVVVIESRTYLGREITATLRPWVTVGTACSLWGCLFECMGIKTGDGEIPLKADDLKVALEDLLLNAGVGLLYASLPVSIMRGSAGIEGVVIGNKSGRQVIAAPAAVDSTETALVCRLAGGSFTAPPAMARYTRTLEFDRVGPLDVSTIAVSPGLGIVDDTLTVHRGYREGHVFVTFELDLPGGDGQIESMRREIRARELSLPLIEFLVSQVSSFQGAFLGFASFELSGPQTGRLHGPDDDPFLGPTSGLWCLNEAARLPDTTGFRDPVTAACYGEEAAGVILDTPARPLAHEPAQALEPVDASPLEVHELEGPQQGRPYDRVQVPASHVAVLPEGDVLVVGGGTSGTTAAITAAGEGVKTVLLEMNSGLGGTGTVGGVRGYWYGRHVGFSAAVEALTDEVHGAIGHSGGTWNIEAKMHALLREAMRVDVQLLWRVIAFGTVTDDEKRVRGVVAATSWGPIAVLARVVIDATGDGDLAAFAGAGFVYGVERDYSTMWCSLAQFTTPARTRNNFTSSVEISNVEDYTRAILAGRRRGTDVHDHGVYLAPRETRHVLADVVLTHTDQLVGRHWPDVVNVHYSNHDVKGPSTSPWVRVGLIPPNLEIEIPYRALIPRGLEGLIVVGKAISATHDALAAIRMQADMENLGGVAALAAVQSLCEGRSPGTIDVPALQRRLVREGIITEDLLAGSTDRPIYTDRDLTALVDALDGSRPLYAFSDMEMGEIFSGSIPFVDVCTAGDRIVPYLEAALANAEGLRRIHLAQALAWYGSRAAVPVLIEEIDHHLHGDALPVRDNQIRHANYPPDQGAMPDVVYLLYSLGMVRDRRSLSTFARVVDLMDATQEGLRDRRQGTFYYVEAVCWGVEQLADPTAIPILRKLHAFSPLRDQVVTTGFQVDYFEERQAYLELCIAIAQVRCGDTDALRTLISYLDDVRGLLAERAHAQLVALTGEDFGKDVNRWMVGLSRRSS